jgi:microcystin-dependent protein
MALKLKKLGDSQPGTIVSAIKSMTEDPEGQYSSANRWLLCDGQTLNTTTNPEYTALFNVIGTKYGGTGATDFKVPNLHNVAGSKSNASLTNVDNVAVLRGATSANWAQISNADETANRNNTKSGTLSGNSAAVTGNIDASISNSLVNASVSGTPGLNNTPSLSNVQMSMRTWPRHQHTQERVARNIVNDGGYQTTGGNRLRQYRNWYWSSASGSNEAESRKGGNDSHNHSIQTSIQSVSGNLVPSSTNLAVNTSHNFNVTVNGTPNTATTVDQHAQLRFYIKY